MASAALQVRALCLCTFCAESKLHTSRLPIRCACIAVHCAGCMWICGKCGTDFLAGAAAAVDRIASPLEGPLYTDDNGDGHNRLSPEAAIREARYDNNWDDAQNVGERHPIAPLFNTASMDPAAVPRPDAGTKALQAAGLNV